MEKVVSKRKETDVSNSNYVCSSSENEEHRHVSPSKT